jgi:hypothetical protein
VQLAFYDMVTSTTPESNKSLWYFLSTREGKLAVTARDKGGGEKETAP